MRNLYCLSAFQINSSDQSSVDSSTVTLSSLTMENQNDNYLASDSESLPQLFAKAEADFQHLEDGSVSSSPAFIHELIKKFEIATKFVSILGLFSRNEKLDEISTSDLRYLLLPAYLAKSFLKLNDDRLERLQTAEVYIKDFLGRCKDYEVPGHAAIPYRLMENSAEMELTRLTPAEHLQDASAKRATKIAALNQKMDSREKAAQLKKRIDEGTADDDVERAFYQNVINTWILDLLDEWNFVQEERAMLEHRAKLARGETVVEKIVNHPLDSKVKKIGKPITIVKNEIQKRVFGAGYPSLPSLTIEEFYQELVDEGKMPGPGSSKTVESLNYQGPTEAQLLGDELKKENEIETDEPEALQNARDYDDWKDEHRRGWGNRMGKG